MFTRTLSVWLLFPVLAIAGCGERTYKVSGTVTFQGTPIESGSIVFEAADGGPGVASSGIQAGKYELYSKPGLKKVLISASRVRPGTENDPQPLRDEYIPEKYNTATELTKEVLPADNHFNFALRR